MLVGRVLYGINNIYTVQVNGALLICRIKGKVLKTEKKFYNPIAAGDNVEILPDPLSPGNAWIVGRLERKSSLIRWNKKKKAVQVMAANADLLFCIASSRSPPFRPRFVDRVLISGEAGSLEPVIIINKCDLGLDRETKERLAAYRDIGFPVIYCSALTGMGIPVLRKAIKNKTAVFAGQSGVGKSALINALDAGLNLRVGEISSKYNRGVHTTNYAVMVSLKNGTRIIDTPGIREFEITGVSPRELQHYFREFAPYAARCSYHACLHLNEPDCAVREALEKDRIHPDRYESYLRLYDAINDFQKSFYG